MGIKIDVFIFVDKFFHVFFQVDVCAEAGNGADGENGRKKGRDSGCFQEYEQGKQERRGEKIGKKFAERNVMVEVIKGVEDESPGVENVCRFVFFQCFLI